MSLRAFSNLTPFERPMTSADAFIAVFDVPRGTGEKLEHYAGLLRQWQKAVNLVAPSTLDDIWHRHIADSAQLVALVAEKLPAVPADPPRMWVDLGSGAGFPGLVAAILLSDQPGWRFHLIESHGRKCAFLREVARKCGVTVDIHTSRIEDARVFNDNVNESVSVISARALASLPELLQISQRFIGGDTQCFFLKGKTVENEIRDARRRLTFSSSLFPSLTERDGHILQVSDVRWPS